MNRDCLRNSLDIENLIRTIVWKQEERKLHPYFMRTFGTCIYCGAQGEGKTLSAVQYVLKLCQLYPRAILVTNVAIKDRPFNTEMVLRTDENGKAVLNDDNEPIYDLIKNDGTLVTTDYILDNVEYEDWEPITVEYMGLNMLKNVNNEEYGVIFFIDEIHLELNSLESKNIDIEVMVEISQQRKQRKHIVGTSQVFMRMAKPLREQIYDIVLCSCWFGCVQYNRYINGSTAIEKNGKLEADVKGRYLWFHSPEMYQQYDTYAKMRRYNKEWKGRKRLDNIYDSEVKSDVSRKR